MLYTQVLTVDEAAPALLTYPAIITHIDSDGDVSLFVFFDQRVSMQTFAAHPMGVAYSVAREAGTWMWPPREDAATKTKIDASKIDASEASL